MFGWFKPPTFIDPALGELRRTRGRWRGTIRLDGVAAPLALPGGGDAPDPRVLDLARGVPSAYPGWRPAIAQALFEHYEPYADAVAEEGEESPRLAGPGDVWARASVDFVQVLALGGDLAVEIGYRVAWDGEHTLGAVLRGGALMGLNGSVLRP